MNAESTQRTREDAIELQHRPLVEHDGVQIARLQTAAFQAPFNRRQRKGRVVLAAREPLLLHCADRQAVDDKGSR
jgi:hypothetical protein